MRERYKMKKYLDLPLRIFLMISGIFFVFALPTLIGIGETLTINFKPFWEFIEINIGILGAIMVQIAPKKLGNLFKKVIGFFESVPDLLIICLFMFFVITLYK